MHACNGTASIPAIDLFLKGHTLYTRLFIVQCSDRTEPSCPNFAKAFLSNDYICSRSALPERKKRQIQRCSSTMHACRGTRNLNNNNAVGAQYSHMRLSSVCKIKSGWKIGKQDTVFQSCWEKQEAIM